MDLRVEDGTLADAQTALRSAGNRGYARVLPYLGFDPAPGDVGLNRDLARRHDQVAREVRQVLTQVDQVDLTPWQGRSGQAVQALRATFPPALRSMASTADTLQEATSRWADVTRLRAVMLGLITGPHR